MLSGLRNVVILEIVTRHVATRTCLHGADHAVKCLLDTKWSMIWLVMSCLFGYYRCSWPMSTDFSTRHKWWASSRSECYTSPRSRHLKPLISGWVRTCNCVYYLSAHIVSLRSKLVLAWWQNVAIVLYRGQRCGAVKAIRRRREGIFEHY